MSSENLYKIYIIETKIVIFLLSQSGEKTRGGKMKVSPIMLLKTNGEKMSEIGPAIILLKIIQL